MRIVIVQSQQPTKSHPNIFPLRMSPLFRIPDVSCKTVPEDCVGHSIAGTYESLLNVSVYVGDSAALSFLQSIRRLVEGRLGVSPFTMDLNRHNIVEASISTASGYQFTYAMPDVEAALYLVDSFFDNVRNCALQCIGGKVLPVEANLLPDNRLIRDIGPRSIQIQTPGKLRSPFKRNSTMALPGEPGLCGRDANETRQCLTIIC